MILGKLLTAAVGVSDMRVPTLPWYEASKEDGDLEAAVKLAPSAAGPIHDGDENGGLLPPLLGHSRWRHGIRYNLNPSAALFGGARRHGDVFMTHTLLDERPAIVTSHPDHARSLFASPRLAPSVAGESAIRPVVGLSVLTAVGDRHTRQRKLLMPSFHGEAITRYRTEIFEATTREIDQWQAGTPFELAVAARRITLDVIMSGIFGIDRRSGAEEQRLRSVVSRILRASVGPIPKIGELVNIGRTSLVGPRKWVLNVLDRAIEAVIIKRRAEHVPGTRHDVLSLLLDARDDDGAALSNTELRNELLTLILAGHETSANSIAWAFERILRSPIPYDRLRDVVRSGEDPDDYVEATIREAIRVRPVIPIIGRRVNVPWQLGDYVAPAGSRVLVAVVLLHHREDLYPNPFVFDPNRFVGIGPKPGAWLPFGGGNRRCLGAGLAMEEVRIVVSEIARRTDLVPPDSRPEQPAHRNVTMIPRQGCRAIATSVSR